MTEIIGGKHAVYHALKAKVRKVHRIWVSRSVKPQAVSTLMDLAEQRQVPVAPEDKAFFASRVPLETHQGIAAEVDPSPLVDLETLLLRLEGSPAGSTARLILLDGIEDPQNLGALLRTALCLGVSGAIWSRHHMAPLSAVAVKAAAGAVEYLPLCRVTNLSQAIGALKEASFWVYGASARAEQAIWDLDVPPRAALVIGSEGRGLGRRVEANCDALVRIPMHGPLQALNASVAGGILLAHFCRSPGHSPK